VDDKLSYLFDFGDEWRVCLALAEARPFSEGQCPAVLESRGEPHRGTATNEAWMEDVA